MVRAFVSVLWATSLLSCATLGGLDLREIQVGALSLAASRSGALCPGDDVPLIGAAALVSGEKAKTQGAGKGTVRWSSFIGQIYGGSLNGDGILSVSHDPRATLGRPVHVSLRVANQGAAAELDIPVRYDCGYWANFNGAAGRDGGNGANGTDDTAAGSGGNGDDGHDGQQVQVVASMVPGPVGQLLSIFVRGVQTQHLYYLDPAHGSLLLRANGGDGGDGGSGGFGGPDNRYGGDGDGGNAGNGGAFFIQVSPEARQALSTVVRFENRGGRGGKGNRRGREGRQGPPTVF